MTIGNVLYRKCKKSLDPTAIQKTIEILKSEIQNKNNIIGLAANQLGIEENICIIKIFKDLVFVNPEIIEHSEETFQYHEGCYSFPNTYIKTARYKKIVVKSDNNDLMEFSYKEYDNLNNLELACVQHEIDHLNGITMYDRKK
jgi:peptide deformylase